MEEAFAIFSRTERKIDPRFLYVGPFFFYSLIVLYTLASVNYTVARSREERFPASGNVLPPERADGMNQSTPRRKLAKGKCATELRGYRKFSHNSSPRHIARSVFKSAGIVLAAHPRLNAHLFARPNRQVREVIATSRRQRRIRRAPG